MEGLRGRGRNGKDRRKVFLTDLQQLEKGGRNWNKRGAGKGMVSGLFRMGAIRGSPTTAVPRQTQLTLGIQWELVELYCSDTTCHK